MVMSLCQGCIHILLEAYAFSLDTPGCCCRCCLKQATMAGCSCCRSRTPPAPPSRQWQLQRRQQRQRQQTAHRWRGFAICWQRAALMPAGRMGASWWRQLRGGAPRSSSRRGGAAAGSSDCTCAVWPSVKIEWSFSREAFGPVVSGCSALTAGWLSWHAAESAGVAPAAGVEGMRPCIIASWAIVPRPAGPLSRQRGH